MHCTKKMERMHTAGKMACIVNTTTTTTILFTLPSSVSSAETMVMQNTEGKQRYNHCL